MARILIVDDEAPVRRSLGRVLADAGHDCVFAASTDEALDTLRTDALDLVLSDINMPGPSGMHLVRKMHEGWPRLPVVMVTAIDDRQVGELAVKLGAAGYLIKPFKPNEILVMVANALLRQQLERERETYLEGLENAVAERTAELQQAVAELQRSEQRLRVSREEMLQRLAKAAEFRDDETAQHLQRMSRYCKLIGERFGLPAQRCEQLRLASLMHDVGKIGIPDAILLKPSRLLPAEYEVMKCHAEIGYKLLSGSDAELLQLAATVAYTHHEKYDGSGYPRGLAGEAIPIEGRIAAVADVFDALTSRRVYRDAISVEDAIRVLVQGRSTHFDPRLVQLFVSLIPTVLALRDEYSDGALDR